MLGASKRAASEKKRPSCSILLNAERLELPPSYEPPKGTPTALTPLGELYLPLEGLIDLEAERQRLGKEIAKTEAELVTVRKETGERKFRRERAGRGRGRASAAGEGFRGAARATGADARLVRRRASLAMIRALGEIAGDEQAAYTRARANEHGLLKFLLWLGIGLLGAAARSRSRLSPAASRSTRSGS